MHPSDQNRKNPGQPLRQPEVADYPADTPQDSTWPSKRSLASLAAEEERFKAFLKRNLNTPPPPVPADLTDLIYAGLDEIDAQRAQED